MLREASSRFSRLSSMLNTEEGIPLKLPDKLSKLVPAHTSFKTKGRKLGGDIHGVWSSNLTGWTAPSPCAI